MAYKEQKIVSVFKWSIKYIIESHQSRMEQVKDLKIISHLVNDMIAPSIYNITKKEESLRRMRIVFYHHRGIRTQIEINFNHENLNLWADLHLSFQ